MDLTEYRNSDIEKLRSADLMSLLPENCRGTVLDIGARDGWYSFKLADRFDEVTALDIERPILEHPRILCMKGDAANLEFDDEKFDLVFCAEVLEHIPSKQLNQVCSELSRVAKKYILIGVPFKQDIRIGLMKCYTCGKSNPAWGHVNSFDENKLKQCFSLCDIKKISFVGENNECTNALSVFLFKLAGNPYGTYNQEEPCIYCGAKLKEPPQRNILQKIATKMAFCTRDIQQFFHRPHPNWIHILFAKR